MGAFRIVNHQHVDQIQVLGKFQVEFSVEFSNSPSSTVDQFQVLSQFQV
jgi:hypothetical protein